jgi:hypothetical protein
MVRWPDPPRETLPTNPEHREHPEASEVFVTGTFDDWGKTQQLHKVGDVFEKTVDLPSTDKILYKVRRPQTPSLRPPGTRTTLLLSLPFPSSRYPARL